MTQPIPTCRFTKLKKKAYESLEQRLSDDIRVLIFTISFKNSKLRWKKGKSYIFWYFHDFKSRQKPWNKEKLFLTNWLTNRPPHQLTAWQFDNPIDWLTDRLLCDWAPDWLSNHLTALPTDQQLNRLTEWLITWPTAQLINIRQTNWLAIWPTDHRTNYKVGCVYM